MPLRISRCCFYPLRPTGLRSEEVEGARLFVSPRRMSEPTRSGPPSTAAVPTQVAPVIGSDNDNGTLEHAHNPRAHACVPAPPPIPGLLVEDDQECRVHDTSVPSGPAGRRGLDQQLDKCESQVGRVTAPSTPGIFFSPGLAARPSPLSAARERWRTAPRAAAQAPATCPASMPASLPSTARLLPANPANSLPQAALVRRVEEEPAAAALLSEIGDTDVRAASPRVAVMLQPTA